jgi:hypothetical protein
MTFNCITGGPEFFLPKGTYYLKKVWLDKGGLLGIPKSAFYYIAHTDNGEISAEFNQSARAFSYANRSDEIRVLLWAH